MPDPVAALVCPGQGPHSPEMLEPFREDVFFADTYPLVCTTAQTDLLKSMAKDGMSFVRRNEIASLLTVYTSILAAERLRRSGVRFDYTAGYSVGQWSALHLAGLLDFEQLLETVWLRANLMNQVPASLNGSMLAVIGAPTEDVENICAEVSRSGERAVISNFNAPGQLTLAGTKTAILEAEALLEPKARKIARVDVSGAWHCWLLEATVEPFKEHLNTIKFRAPSVPVADNVTGELLPSSESELKTQLACQLASPVMWQQSIRTLSGLGANQFIETGHGNMLTKFGFFIDRKVKHITWNQVEHL